MRAGLRDWLLLISLGAIWGGAFMGTKVATAEVPPLTIAAIRLGLGGLTLGMVLLATGKGDRKSVV